MKNKSKPIHRYSLKVLKSTIHNGPHDIAIVRATVDDVPAVLHLLDTAVKWLVSRDRTGQWGAGPFSENPRRAEQLKEFATTGHGLWLAVKVADGTPMDQNRPSNILPRTVDGEVPGSIIGALAVGERMPYVTPVSEPEFFWNMHAISLTGLEPLYCGWIAMLVVMGNWSNTMSLKDLSDSRA